MFSKKLIYRYSIFFNDLIALLCLIFVNKPLYLNPNKEPILPMTKNIKSGKNSVLEDAWKLYYKNKFDEALTKFDSVLHEGTDLSAKYGRVCALFRIMDYESALSELSEMIIANPHNASYHHTRALIYGANEQYDMALKDFEVVTSVEPDNGELLCDLGGLYLVREEFNKARDCFERSADIDKSCACAWFGKGMVSYFLKEYKKANEYFNITIKLDAKHLLAYMARAETNFCSNQKKEALKDLKRVLSMDEDLYDEFSDLLGKNSDNFADGSNNENDEKDLEDDDALEVY